MESGEKRYYSIREVADLFKVNISKLRYYEKEFPTLSPKKNRSGEGAAADERELKRFIDGNSHRVAYDAVDAPTVLVEYAPELRAIETNWPKIRFHALREHAGLVFQKKLDG